MTEILTIVTALIPFSGGNLWMQSVAAWLIVMVILMSLRSWLILLVPFAALCIMHACHVDRDVLMINEPEAALSLIMGLIPLAFLRLKPELVKRVLMTAGYVITFKLFFMKSTIINTSLDACFLACLLPFYPFSLWGIFPLLAIVWSGSSTGLACACISLLSFVRWRRAYQIGYLLVASASIALFCILTSWRHLLNPKGRFEFWQLTLESFLSTPHLLFGLGPDSFARFGAQLQLTRPELMKLGLMYWAHSDWLQILIEYGLVGLLLCLLLIGLSLYRHNIRSPFQYKISILSYSFMMLTQFPLRHPLSLLLGFWLLQQAFDRSQLQEHSSQL